MTVPLLLPAGLAFDSQSNLYIAETSGHQILRVTPAGNITSVAGTGTQGYAGDGGLATAALLDSPVGVAVAPDGDLLVSDTHNHVIRRIIAATGVISTIAGTGRAGFGLNGSIAAKVALNGPTFLALDGAGDVYFADSQNHLVRRVEAVSGILTTVAGNGTQGFSGDGESALAAALDTPTGLAVDAAGNIFLADSHNQRIRRVDAVSGIITSVAGTGSTGFSGDLSPAARAVLHLPAGLTLDAAGNLFLADSGNQRIRRIDAASGQITTVAGDGTQAFAGDGGPALSASLNNPKAANLSPAGLLTLSDTDNLRVRQIDGAAQIQTIAGLGTAQPGVLTLSAATTVAYGSGILTATLAASPATGAITFLDETSASPVTLATAQLVGNVASYSTASLAAGQHRLVATYGGDPLHPSAQSTLFALTITPDALTITPATVAALFGQTIPTLTATLFGELPKDVPLLTVALSSAATPASTPGTYPISATLGGSAAGNYTVAQTPANVVIAKAPTSLTLTANSGAYSVQAASSTTGIPTGVATLLDGSSAIASASLNAGGSAVFSSNVLSPGTHTLSSAYSGDQDFLAASSAPVSVSISPVPVADFSLVATGLTTVNVLGGTPAVFSFAAAPVAGMLSSPIQLSVTGLPAGATATFNPAYLPPSANSAAFLLTIQTAKTTGALSGAASATVLCLMLFLFGKRRRMVWRLLFVALCAAGSISVIGCGDRINRAGETSASAKTFNIVVTGTATSTSGTVLTHSAGVTLVLQ